MKSERQKEALRVLMAKGAELCLAYMALLKSDRYVTTMCILLEIQLLRAKKYEQKKLKEGFTITAGKKKDWDRLLEGG